MKPIENIFGFDCDTCEYNRYYCCGNIGNQFRYCQKSAEEVQNLDKLQQENEKLKDKLSKIETLIINHNCDTGDIYYKYNNKFLKSELKQRILEIACEKGSDSND
jgi:hypothetical protein